MDLNEFATKKAEYVIAMHTANDSIRDYAQKEQESIDELIKINEKMELIEVLATNKIVTQLEGEKLKYTNDTQRKSALFVALQEHGEYQDLKNKKRELGRSMGLSLIHI